VEFTVIAELARFLGGGPHQRLLNAAWAHDYERHLGYLRPVPQPAAEARGGSGAAGDYREWAWGWGMGWEGL